MTETVPIRTHRWPRAVGHVLLWLAMGVLLVAGVGKLLDVETFDRSLVAWTVIPSDARLIVAWGLPTIEVFLALAWMARFHRRRTSLAALVLLTSMLTAACIQLSTTRVPSCGCFGVLERYLTFTNDGWVLVAKGGLLLGMILLGKWLTEADLPMRFQSFHRAAMNGS